MSVECRVFPMRFSADPAAMVRFLEVLGLRARLQSGNGAYACLVGASGSVAVHACGAAATGGVRAGFTSLNVLVADVRAAAAALSSAGNEADAWDEAYGVQGAVLLPGGAALGLNEAVQADLYGYRSIEPSGTGAVDVVAVRYSDDFAGDIAFFAHLGFVPDGPPDDPWWCALRGSPTAGVIGLHAPSGPRTPDAMASGWLERPAAAQLGFDTAEPLDELAARLRDAGYDTASVLADQAGPKVVLTDPDGQRVEIHPRSA
jgi:catechol 2,3-dioxygenase-like lactoylglutathione lyase family enzyme